MLWKKKLWRLGPQTIATQQPVARDMRKILMAFRVANDLERMGDLAADIAKGTLRIGEQELIKPLVDIPRMALYIKMRLNPSCKPFSI
ncbi:phosphate signaling complex PhoU family protein [Ferviditalea candida]|uniref:phosphate signaling complex PhoU family protein n=1 Tax=Ferviditalea candida TaxID=3108399 RepID=UPI00352E7772